MEKWASEISNARRERRSHCSPSLCLAIWSGYKRWGSRFVSLFIASSHSLIPCVTLSSVGFPSWRAIVVQFIRSFCLACETSFSDQR
ncbi:hypothetical protein K458DRAFT_154613 [Lentithecium fluviatile CBS 122367]|uniref:Uncharacterized protein n=1 Tax=Lentithecium fluviatile CBS 122367 TaxID=1168545 RepID=A0A6G1JFK2_9PLEO|nr:hypothetical protein K458DRAFT_154613 [Lentithecium fluviatile CBS 122367]